MLANSISRPGSFPRPLHATDRAMITGKVMRMAARIHYARDGIQFIYEAGRMNEIGRIHTYGVDVEIDHMIPVITQVARLNIGHLPINLINTPAIKRDR